MLGPASVTLGLTPAASRGVAGSFSLPMTRADAVQILLKRNDPADLDGQSFVPSNHLEA